MDHNRFDYEIDLLFPIKEFLRRNTSFNPSDTYEFKFPNYLFNSPKINNSKFELQDTQVNVGCFGGK